MKITRIAPLAVLVGLAACQGAPARSPLGGPPQGPPPPPGQQQGQQPGQQTVDQAPTTLAASSRVVLDPHHDYGDRYANGMVPVGDGRYRTAGAAKGYVFACGGYAQNLGTQQGGAGSKGPWFHGTSYSIKEKAHVSGAVRWTARFTDVVRGTTRTITTNDLPTHTTGVFPVRSSDPAYRYDRNPNTIRSQSLSYSLPANPTYGTASCMGGEAGIMLTGAALFNGFDAGGRDAGAWEVQDACGGHPQNRGEYHYHSLSSCITNIAVSHVIGYALDGFAITGPKVGTHNILTTRDLDECHGITSTISQNGRSVSTYHYVMTQDFPYSVSCFRGHATRPPGQTGGGPS